MDNRIEYVKFMLSPSIRGLRVNTEELVKWASGIKSPIYVDNRMSLANYNIRDMIYTQMANHIMANNLRCDAILAAPTAGLHIGASVAKKLNVPFVMIRKNEAYEVVLVTMSDTEGMAIDLVVASNPDAICPGIMLANELKRPFAYIREQKNHGLKNRIEGLPEKAPGDSFGGNAFLLDFYLEKSWKDYALQVIHEDTNYRIEGVDSTRIPGAFQPFEIQGQHCIVLEDLFSTSESAVKQVLAARELGSHIEHIMGIYDYELKESDLRVKEVDVKKHAFITARQFLDIAEEIDPKVKEQRPLLNEFLADPRNWKQEVKVNQ